MISQRTLTRSNSKWHRVRLRHTSFYEPDTAFKTCGYSLLFGTLGGFLDRKYYGIYSSNLSINSASTPSGWNGIRELVDHYVTAEDITMSLLYTFSSGLPPIAVVVPESELMVDDFMRCSSEWSASSRMHRKSTGNRNTVFVNSLEVLGYYRNDSAFSLKQSTLFVDVMPQHEASCWIG